MLVAVSRIAPVPRPMRGACAGRFPGETVGSFAAGSMTPVCHRIPGNTRSSQGADALKDSGVFLDADTRSRSTASFRR
jgi:hypothetical protein